MPLELRLLPAAAVVVFGVCLGTIVAGCGESPRKSFDDLYEEERKLPAVYLTAETQTKVIAPGDKGLFVDEETGELCWPALTCLNPDCPAKGTESDPFLFISPDPANIVNPDGTVGYDRSLVNKADNFFGNCPECLKIRNLKAESDKDRQQYSNWAVPYVLPETARRQEELAKAREERREYLENRINEGK